MPSSCEQRGPRGVRPCRPGALPREPRGVVDTVGWRACFPAHNQVQRGHGTPKKQAAWRSKQSLEREGAKLFPSRACPPTPPPFPATFAPSTDWHTQGGRGMCGVGGSRLGGCGGEEAARGTSPNCHHHQPPPVMNGGTTRLQPTHTHAQQGHAQSRRGAAMEEDDRTVGTRARVCVVVLSGAAPS